MPRLSWKAPRSAVLLFLTVAFGVLPARLVAAQEPHRAVLTRVAPSYPELARRMHIAGVVVVLASIRPDGTVSDTHAQSGHALLSLAAEQAVKQWQFAPAPEPSRITVSVGFTNPAN